jgi:hypothetical protein
MIASLWPIAAYRKIDDYKVELTTRGVDTLMRSLLNRIMIVSPANFEKVGKDWQAYRKSPSGTGPWKMKAWTPRERAELECNTDYWNKDRIPKSERLVVLPIPDVSTRTAALLAGRVDWTESPAPDSLDKLKAGGCKIEINAIPHMWPYTPWSSSWVASPCRRSAACRPTIRGSARPASRSSTTRPKPGSSWPRRATARPNGSRSRSPFRRRALARCTR